MSRKRTISRPTSESAARECLGMVHAALARYIPMDGCAPMFYEDAIRILAEFMFWVGGHGEEPTGDPQQYAAFVAARKDIVARITDRKSRLADLLPPKVVAP